MLIDYLLQTFEQNSLNDAIVWNNNVYSYGWLKKTVEYWTHALSEREIVQGEIVALQADFSPNAIALLIALIRHNCIIAPLAPKSKVKQEEYCRIAQIEYLIEVDPITDKVNCTQLQNKPAHPILLSLKQHKHPGLVIFSSGSTGKNKATVHDFLPLLEKFKTPKHRVRVIGFLLFDHIGGLNTLFYTLFNAGCLITANLRTPQYVCQMIECFKAEALTTTPTFLNLLLLSGIYQQYDLSSLHIINYGTEVMPEGTLKKLNILFPHIRLSQAYGLSEVGVLPVRSKSSDSLYIKIAGEGFQTRIVDGLLEIKADSSMLGYLNAPNPFTEDGWFKTGDAVEIAGEYIRVLGRTSDLINVGGEKVYPAEIENILEQMDGVEVACVFAESNAIIGQIVAVKVKISTEETVSQFRIRLHTFCKSKLPSYKIPRKIILTHSILHNERFKKMRQPMEAIS